MAVPSLPAQVSTDVVEEALMELAGCEMMTLAVAVQVAASVIVTEYPPGDKPFIVAVVCPPVHT